MIDDDALRGLIEQHRSARERYYLCKRQELSPSKDGLTGTARRLLSTNADAAWEKAEAALWRHRSPFSATMAYCRKNDGR